MNFPKHRTVYISDSIEKRRKLNSGEPQQNVFNMSISEEMKKNIETTFQDQIKQLVKESRSLQELTPTIDSDSILAEINTCTQKIPCYLKSYEESMMRPAQDGEENCINEENCECTLIAKTDPTIDDEDAFIGTALPERHKMCVLCVRKKVSQQFYHYLITNTTPDTCIQPHYNVIEKPEEYNKDCVFLPISVSGITDPFVMHRRHNYKYRGKSIIQSSSVNFSQASMTCETKTNFITREFHTKPLQYTEANYFQKINEASNYKIKYRLEMNLYLNIPIIFDGNKSIVWEQIVTTILDASVFLPIIFGQKSILDKTTKNIPIVHIISKGLPQRSQFRNFLSISLDCLKKSPEFKLFFKQLFVWSIIGIHYSWNRICLPLYKRVQLFEFCCIQDSDWEKMLTINVRLFFFMIKEYLCFIIKQNPGLHNVLVQTTDWIKYETEIFNVMNEVRYIFATNDSNPLKQMLILTQKLLPRPNIVNWPRLQQTNRTPSTLKLFEFLQKAKYQPVISLKLETINHYKKELQRMRLRIYSNKNLCRILRVLELDEDMKVGECFNSSDEIKQQFYNMMFVDKLLDSIRQTRLPIHHVENQLNVSIKRHDLNTSDEKFVETLYSATTFYFCIGCQDVKACYDYGQKKKENTIFSYGHNKLALDPYSDKTYCMGTNTRRKQKETSCMAVPCIKISLFGKIVSFFGKSFTLCSLCGTLCCLRLNKCYLKKGMISCGNCKKQTQDQEFCGYCVRKSSSLIKYRIYDDENKDKFENPWSTICLCPRHRSNHWSKDKILLKSFLFANLKEKI